MDFLINGLPENESHDKKNNNNKNKKTNNNDLERLAEEFGIDISDLNSFTNINLGSLPGGDDLISMSNAIINMLTQGKGPFIPNSQPQNANANNLPTGGGGTLSGNVNIHNINVTPVSFPNGEAKTFINNTDSLASVNIKENENISSDFVTTFGISDEDNIDINVLKGFDVVGDIDMTYLLNNFTTFGISGYSEKYILCTANAKNTDCVGIFFAIVETDSGYTVVVPKYGNIYKEDLTLYDSTVDTEMFENGVFKFVNISKIRLALEWMLTSNNKKHYLSPTEFGNIKPIFSGKEVIKNDKTFIHVAYIISNNDEKSVQFKKDIGAENEKVFDLYLKFDSRDCSPAVLYEALKHVDFNTNNLFTNSELKNHGDIIYIDADFGVIPQYLHRIITDRIDPDDYIY